MVIGESSWRRARLDAPNDLRVLLVEPPGESIADPAIPIDNEAGWKDEDRPGLAGRAVAAHEYWKTGAHFGVQKCAIIPVDLGRLQRQDRERPGRQLLMQAR